MTTEANAHRATPALRGVATDHELPTKIARFRAECCSPSMVCYRSRRQRQDWRLSLNSERIPPFTAGVNRVRSVPQTTGDSRAGTPIFSITCVKGLRTGSADSHRRHAAGVGPHSTHVCGAPQARLMAFGREGVTGAGTGTARFDRLGESRVEKPRGDDSLADGSTCDGATGRSRPRDETRPADAERDGPETDRKQSGFPLSREAPSFTTGRTSHIEQCHARIATPSHPAPVRFLVRLHAPERSPEVARECCLTPARAVERAHTWLQDPKLAALDHAEVLADG